MQPDEAHAPQDDAPPDDAPHRAASPQEDPAAGQEDLPVPAAEAPPGTEPPPDEAQTEAEPPDASSSVRRWLGRLFPRSEEKDLSNLEVRMRLLDAVEQAVKPHRAIRPLPFNQITVHVLAPADRDQRLYESAIDHLEPSFEQAARDRLREAGFDLRPELSITTRIYKKAPKRWASAFETSDPVYVELKEKTARATATLTVVKGRAEQERYRIGSDAAVSIGRLREVVDERYGHVVRRNHVAFLDHTALDDEDGEVNKTVSRRHARIAFDARSSAFLLHNEAGSTTVSREGYPRPVRVGGQAVKLQDGDLIYLGSACLRFETRRR